MSNSREDEQDDPLTAIKQMRLEQLAVCRLKSDEEMQAMREVLQSRESETALDDE